MNTVSLCDLVKVYKAANCDQLLSELCSRGPIRVTGDDAPICAALSVVLKELIEAQAIAAKEFDVSSEAAAVLAEQGKIGFSDFARRVVHYGHIFALRLIALRAEAFRRMGSISPLFVTTCQTHQAGKKGESE